MRCGPQPPIEVLLGKELSRHWQAHEAGAERAYRCAARPVRKGVRLCVSRRASSRTAPQLGPHDYEIALFGARHARGQLHRRQTLAVATRTASAALPGLETADPAFGLPAVWIDADIATRRANVGYTLVDPITVLMAHLGECCACEAPLLLSRADVVATARRRAARASPG